MIEIIHRNQTLAIIIPSDFYKDGIEFFTPDDYSQQLAYMNRPAGYEIEPHTHNKVPREVFYTQETLFIRKGRLIVDFYTQDQEYIKSIELSSGDVILLASGGHGFRMVEDTEMIEVKQGPFAGDKDKIRFKKHQNEK